MAITNAQTTWRGVYNWSSALVAFRIHFGERLPDSADTHTLTRPE